MRKLWFSLIITFAVIVSTLSVTTIVYGQKSDTGVSDVVDRYIKLTQNHNYTEAYLLLSTEFRNIIPLETFIKYHEMLDNGSNEIYHCGQIRQLSESRTEVEILNTDGKHDGSLLVEKESDEWYILADWQAFFPIKVNLLSPVSEYRKDGFSVTLKYFLNYPITQESIGGTVMRLDLGNDSDHEIRWELPIPGTNAGFIEDTVSNTKYYPSYGYSIGATKYEGYSYITQEGGLGTILLGPGAKATVRIHFEDVIPTNTTSCNIFLSGFSFTDTKENWDIEMENIIFKPELIPAQ